MKLRFNLLLLLACGMLLPGCYQGYQDAEIPADYKDTTDPVNLREAMKPPTASAGTASTRLPPPRR